MLASSAAVGRARSRSVTSRRITVRSAPSPVRICEIDGLDRELLAVRAQPPDVPELPHAPARLSGAREAVHVLPMRGAEALRDQDVERAADHLGALAPEHPLGGRIEQHDPLRLVDRHDRVHRRVDDARKARLALAALALGGAQLA